MVDPQYVSLDVKTIINFLYVAGGTICTALVFLVGIAWRAGGDVREIKVAIHNHGPRIEAVEAEQRQDRERIVRLETKAGIAVQEKQAS